MGYAWLWVMRLGIMAMLAVALAVLLQRYRLTDEQKELVRITAFWIETWLRSQYKEIDIRYIVHDAAAKEVDQNTFYHIREGGGTKISSAYQLCNKLIEERYQPPDHPMRLQFPEGRYLKFLVLQSRDL